MTYCERCNGYGVLYVRGGDDDRICPDCNGTGEISQLTIQEACDICRCWGFGGNVTERLHKEALSVLKALEPVIEYRTVAEDDVYYEAVDGKRWREAQDEYQRMLKE